MVQEFVIPGRLPGLNEYTDACRGNARAGGRMKRQAQQRCERAIRKAGLEPMQPPVSVLVTWFEENRRRDKDNVRFAVKFILDALVECGVIGDDGWQWISEIQDEYEIDPSRPRVVVTIEEDG